MNKHLLIVFSCLTLLFASCSQQSDIANLQSQIDELKSGRIASIESQVSSINASISSLQEADREIKGYITALQNTASELQKGINTANGKIDDLQKALSLVNTAIETLQAKDSALEKRIDDLKDYVDTQLKNAKDWVSATFATLEQYNGIVSEIGGIKGSISAINTTMEQMESRLNGKIESTKAEIESAYTKAIGTLDTSMKNWVNDQLKGYWTIAETEGKLAALKGSLEKEDESLKGDIDKLSTSLDSAKTELTEGYKAAIKKAIDENNGLIDGKISEAVSGLNTIIDSEVSTINKRIDAIEKRIANLETQVSALVSRIQSLTYIPRYTDGASTMWVTIQPDGSTVSRDTLEFRVSPADCADSLVKVWDKAITAEAVSLITRGTQETISLPVVSVSGGNGKLSVVLDGRSLGEKFFTGEQQIKAVVIISDGNNERTSEYVSMVAKDDPKIPNNIILYTSSDGKIVVPNNAEAFGAAIVSNKYENGRGIILFDGDVTYIGDSAFYNCSGLTSIILPSSVTSVGGSAFWYCSGLTSIILPSSLTSIGSQVFWGCSKLTAIHIPKSVVDIKWSLNPFAHCLSLVSVTVDPDNPVYDSRNDCNAIIETKTNRLITGCNNTVIPETVTTIGECAFENSRITSVNIPSSVNSIEDDAFLWCGHLISIIVNPGNPVYDSRNNCNALIETNSNTLIKGCINTRIPNSIETIDGGAFSFCPGLTTIEIPNSVTSVGSSAFWYCADLSSIIVDPGNSVYDSRNNCNAIIETQTNRLVIGCKNTIIPDTVIEIWNSAFETCTSLSSIEIPNSVIFIGERAFRGCTGLTSVELPNSLQFISDAAFFGCSGLSTINIPNSVHYLGGLLFYGCSSLSTIVIPNSVQYLGAGAFQNCSGLNSIYCLATIPPDNPNEYGQWANSYIVCDMWSVRESDMFKNTNNCPIYVPKESVGAYKTKWSLFADRIKAIP